MGCNYCKHEGDTHAEGCPKLHPGNLEIIKLFTQGYINGRNERVVEVSNSEHVTFALGYSIGVDHRKKLSSKKKG